MSNGNVNSLKDNKILCLFYLIMVIRGDVGFSFSLVDTLDLESVVVVLGNVFNPREAT